MARRGLVGDCRRNQRAELDLTNTDATGASVCREAEFEGHSMEPVKDRRCWRRFLSNARTLGVELLTSVRTTPELWTPGRPLLPATSRSTGRMASFGPRLLATPSAQRDGGQ